LISLAALATKLDSDVMPTGIGPSSSLLTRDNDTSQVKVSHDAGI
jgi:hypothetical protein